MPALKNKQHEIFCQEYARTAHGAKSWVAAGGSEKSASAQASRLLNRRNVCERIMELQRDAQEKAGVDAAWVLAQAAKIFTADIRKCYDEHGDLLPPHEWPDDVAMTIQGVDSSVIPGKDGDPTVTIKKLRRIDRLKALEIIGRHVDVQAFKDRVEHDATDRLADAIRQGRKRARVKDE